MSDADWNTPELKQKLLDFLQPTDVEERGGVILADGRIVELLNVADDPTTGYVPSDDLFDFLDDLVALFHTHPGESANLSTEDWETFVLWPSASHFIIGIDGVRGYAVKGAAVVNA
jgi:hypothetical protein